MKFKLLCFVGFLLMRVSAPAQNNYVREMYQKLSLTFGEARNPPELIIVQGKSDLIAGYFTSPSPTIKLDQEIIDICRSFGKDSTNALAVILSHELAHFYRRHDWCGEFAFAVRGTALSQNLKNASNTNRSAFESQADVDGLFNACLSGYRPFGAYPKLLAKIYDVYKRPDKIPNYPTKKERIESAKAAEQQATEGYAVFLTANTWLQLSNYEVATQHFDWLLKKFPSREIFNNAGVAQLLQALSLKARHEVPFIYPVELDSRSRLFTPNTRSGLEDNDRKIEVLLKTAQRNFEEALRKDPDYTPACVNLACVFDLLGNYEAAIGKINELKSQRSLSSNALTIRAIAYLHNEQMEKANRDFAEAQRLSGFGTTHNFALAQKGLAFVQNASEVVEWLEKNTPTQSFVSTKPPLGTFKAISATPTIKLALNPTTTLSGILTTGELSLESKSNAKVLKISKILSIEALTVGSSKANVKEVLGLPIKENPTYWLYDGLIVNFDGDAGSELLQYQLKE